MEFKWISIMVAVLFGATFVALGVEAYSQSQCRIEAIRAGIEADKIKTACGVNK